MEIELEYIKKQFGLFNEKYFGGELPEPEFTICNARTYIGQFRHIRKRRWMLSPGESHYYLIKISQYYNLSKREIQNVLLHEMIHFHISFKGIRDTAPHGEVLHKLMDTLNSRYGWEIRVSAKHSATRQAADRQDKKRLVLALTTTNGRRYLTVVNGNYKEKIEKKIGLATNVKAHRWFYSSDRYFDGFPAVRTLRARKVDKKTFDKMAGDN